MTSLILLEDEPVLLGELAEFLGDHGYRVTPASSMESFHRLYAPERHRIAILDLGLPDGDGMTLVESLRERSPHIGIVVFTARSGHADKLSGLGLGADYYLPKTCDLQELAATLLALKRRLGVQDSPRWVLHGSPRQLVPPGHPPIALSGQDYQVLLTIATGGESVSREAICKALGEDFIYYDQRRMDTQMRRLRRKVEEACGLELPITTLRSIGYRFHGNIEVIA